MLTAYGTGEDGTDHDFLIFHNLKEWVSSDNEDHQEIFNRSVESTSSVGVLDNQPKEDQRSDHHPEYEATWKDQSEV